MNVDTLFASWKQAAHRSRLEGQAWAFSQPIEIDPALQRALDTDEDQELYLDEGFYMLEPYADMETVVTWYWLAGPGASSSLWLTLIATPQHGTFVLLESDDFPAELVARFDGPATPALLANLLADLARKNGADYRRQLFGSFPSATENHRPDLLSAEALRAAYQLYVDTTADRSDVDAHMSGQYYEHTIV